MSRVATNRTSERDVSNFRSQTHSGAPRRREPDRSAAHMHMASDITRLTQTRLSHSKPRGTHARRGMLLCPLPRPSALPKGHCILLDANFSVGGCCCCMCRAAHDVHCRLRAATGEPSAGAGSMTKLSQSVSSRAFSWRGPAQVGFVGWASASQTSGGSAAPRAPAAGRRAPA